MTDGFHLRIRWSIVTIDLVAVGVKGLQLRFPQYAWIAEMTCGYAVYEAVDNPAHAWITTLILWITKKISIAPLGRLRRSRTGE